MAAGVLVFVMALGIAISSFSEAKQTADVLIQYNDREYSTQYAQDTGSKNRIVGAETIIPTIYRAYKEKYKIVFCDENGDPLYLFKQYNYMTKQDEPVNYIDLEKQVQGNDRLKDNFIMALLYGNKATLKDENYREDTDYDFEDFNNELKKNSEHPIIFLHVEGIYDTIKENTFIEEFGVYYQEEVEDPSIETDDAGTEIDGEYNSSSPKANKNKARVITYTQVVKNNP